MGVVFVREYQGWIGSLLRAPLCGLSMVQHRDDEGLVNGRVACLHKSAKSRIAKLPHPEFMLGCFRPAPETLIYHANFTPHNTALGPGREKLKRMRDVNAWFLPEASVHREGVSNVSQHDFFASRRVGILKSHFVEAVELSVIEKLIADNNVRTVLEIGVNKGGTAKKLLDACPLIKRYIGIDIARNSFLEKDSPQWRERDFDDAEIASEINGDPRSTVLLLKRGSIDFPVTESYDLVFIDGNHDLEWVRHDVKLAKSANARVIVWHDYGTQPGVTQSASEEGGAVHVLGTKIAYKIGERP